MNRSMKDLFGDTPLENIPKARNAFARHTDLPTSHEAAKRVDPKVPHLEIVVLAAIVNKGMRGGTWNELAAVTGIDKGSVSPRFKPLRNKGFITATYDVEGNTVKRDHQIVWIATDKGRAFLTGR